MTPIQLTVIGKPNITIQDNNPKVIKPKEMEKKLSPQNSLKIKKNIESQLWNTFLGLVVTS